MLMPKEIKEEKVSMYDPTVNAFREITISQARLLIKSAKEVEKLIGEEEQIYEQNNKREF